MTQVAAICKALLDGETLSIMTGFKQFACTNLPRELSRSVEQKFNVVISKERVDFTSKYGQKGFYFRYRLNHTDYNKEGIQKMRAYVGKETNGGKSIVAISLRKHIPKENKSLNQQPLF
jgi:hypothetical protein